jgi:putative heme-binding domain-containing protein
MKDSSQQLFSRNGVSALLCLGLMAQSACAAFAQAEKPPLADRDELKPAASVPTAKAAAPASGSPAQAQIAPRLPRAPFELLDGDRVVFLGDTLIEREQLYGYLEARLTVRFPNRNVTFRNLGWSADNPLGQSRVSFDWSKPPDEWFRQLIGQIAAVRPTVAFLGYGMASSFAGEAGLPAFATNFNKLIDAIENLSPTNQVRLVLLGPLRHENLGAPLPEPAAHNQQLLNYNRAIAEIAGKRGYPFISLDELLGDGTKTRTGRPLTENGIHLSAYGYSRLADTLEIGLQWPPNAWRVGITSEGQVRAGGYGVQITDLEKTDTQVKFIALTERVDVPVEEGRGKRFPTSSPTTVMQFAGLKPGRYSLKVDGEVILTHTDGEWGRGQAIDQGPQLGQAEALRQAILRKNQLFFHRWRPENSTYLFLFRKYEQGQNAREIPMFDPLVEAEEKQIGDLRKPRPHRYELVPAEVAAGQKKNSTLAPAIPVGRKEAVATVHEAPAPAALLPVPEFETAPGLEVTLFAENPLLAKPIQMNFDPQGRLWVASSSVYPQIQPGQKADDKILILEDTDGDGKAETSTVFADGLLIPTGVEPGNGGAYVGQSTELLHLADTDGDGKADRKRIVLSGFGTEDTHHILHTLRWGHDGQLYMNQSIYIHSHIETPHGVVRLNSGGILNFRPETMELGVFMKGLVNGWGHDFDEFGQSFATDGAGGIPPNGIFYVVPGGMYSAYAGARRTLGSISPGNYPKFCSLETLYSRHFPDDWQGNFITCDFRAHRVVRFSVSEKDSAYVTQEMPDVLRSTNVTFRPIDVKLGPDGALYVADWSNPIIQHGEVDFRDPRRDHEHGRIWRVTVRGRPLAEKPKLVGASNAALLDQLLSPNRFNRRQARRVLTERGTNIMADLKAWTAKQTADKARLEGLWMYQSVDVVEAGLLKQLLGAGDARIRAAATRVLSDWHKRIDQPLERLAERIADEHPRVRLEAMRALSRIPSARSADLVLSALGQPMDEFLEYALWLSINDLADPWVAAIESGEWKFEGRERLLQYGLKALEPALANRVLGTVLSGKPLPRDGGGMAIELIGQAGGPGHLRQLFDQTVHGEFEAPATVRALNALGEAGRLRNQRPSGGLEAIGSLFEHSDEKVRAAAIRLAGTWKLNSFAPALLEAAGSKLMAPTVRQAAFDSLREIGGTAAMAGLRALAEKGDDLAIRRQAVVALASLDLPQALAGWVGVLVTTTNGDESLAFWRSLLNIRGAGPALARALPKTGLPETVVKAGLRAAREGGRNEPDLVAALSFGANVAEEALSLSETELQSIAAKAIKEGDPARGERVYRRADLGCISCHAIGGAGGKVGPDLTSIGASAPMDYLVESVLAPNKKIKEGYHSILIQTKDDQEFSGILVREDQQQLFVRNAAGQEVSIPKNNVKTRATGASLMPGGLIDSVNEAERLDLFRFLAELGKPGPFDASKGSVARVWRVRAGTHEIEQFGEEKLTGGLPIGQEWQVLFGLVDGRLPSEAIKAGLNVRNPNYQTSIVGAYVATRFQVAKPGKITIKLAAPGRTSIWLDGKPVALRNIFQADLDIGTHVIALKFDPRNLPDHVRLESPDAVFLMD